MLFRSGILERGIIEGTKTVKANSFELSELIDKKIRFMYTEGSKLALEEHLEQLKILYEYVGTKNKIHKNIFRLGQDRTTDR